MYSTPTDSENNGERKDVTNEASKQVDPCLIAAVNKITTSMEGLRVIHRERMLSDITFYSDDEDAMSIHSDKRRSKVCSICKGESETYHLNYGASSCFSCRAFFRRAIQKDRDPKFVCKRGGKCEITLKTRKQCRKCRYEACLQNGMAPDAVLNSMQKKERFRKMIQKRLGPNGSEVDLLADLPLSYNMNLESIKELVKAAQGTKGDHDEAKLDEQEIGEFMEQLRVKRKVDGDESGRPMDMSNSNMKLHYKRKFIQMYQEEEEHHSSSMSSQSSDSGFSGEGFQPLTSGPLIPSPNPAAMKHKAFSLNFCWMTAQMKFRISPEIIRSFINYHQTGQTLNMNHFIDLLRLLTSLFHNFARQFPDFSVLSLRTQEFLLRENTPLFLAFFLGKYFGSQSGSQQLRWLFPSHKVEGFVQSVPFLRIQESLGLISNPREALMFEKIVSTIANQNFEYKHIHVIAHACLFYVPKVVPHEDVVLLGQFTSESREFLAAEGLDPSQLPLLFQNLETLAKIFSYL
eukprot:TCALIF_13227-PA protein Name:"Similar to thrb Thyroid hormone receptor beta (Paralichthys olivaceus)" AED:0.35 eAED:0.38 QI:0/0/0/0.5/1/1/2/0/516